VKDSRSILNQTESNLVCQSLQEQSQHSLSMELRWLLLHRSTVNKKKNRDSAIIAMGSNHNVGEDELLSLFLETARLEFELKRVYTELLEYKEAHWQQCRTRAAECMQELSDFFSGSKILSKKIKDENLQQWFRKMSI